MPANVESMFSVRQMPWHQEGIILGDYPGTWAEARILAGLDWDPVTTNVYAVAGIDPDGTPHYEPIEGWKIDLPVRHRCGPVAEQRQLHRHRPRRDGRDRRSGPRPAQRQMGNRRGPRRRPVGVVPGAARRTGCLAARRFAHPAVPGDHQPARRHRRLRPARHRGPDRLRQHLPRRRTRRRAHGATFSFIHKSNWRDRIEEARQAVTGARTEMRRYTELARELLGILVSPRQRELFVTEFIPMPPAGLVTDRVARNVEEARQALRLIFESKTTEQVAGTAYGLMQAAGEYLDHVRGARSWETRLNRTLIRPEPLKHRALSLIREVVSAA
jgi:uncharacterized protein DUF932